MGWEISKEFEFCYGHRVWSQKLKEGFATDLCLACRHLHGHQGKVIVTLQSDVLEDGMVTDFKHLGWFKKWLDDVLDHKFIMDINDPLLNHEVPDLDNRRIIIQWDNNGYGLLLGYNNQGLENISAAVKEKYEGMVFVNFVPTSENLSKWLFEVVDKKMSQIGVKTIKVQLFETPKSQSTYVL